MCSVRIFPYTSRETICKSRVLGIAEHAYDYDISFIRGSRSLSTSKGKGGGQKELENSERNPPADIRRHIVFTRAYACVHASVKVKRYHFCRARTACTCAFVRAFVRSPPVCIYNLNGKKKERIFIWP